MIFEEIYNDVIASFGGLWKFKEREKTLEIITPFATTSQKFASVFLTERDGEYIVSDGGWISEKVYDNSFDRSIGCFNKIFMYYQDTFSIKDVKHQNGITYFYKKTNNQISVPSLIFDMANFISTMISLSHVDYADKEHEIENNFTQSAKNYLTKSYPRRDWYFNEYLDSNKEVKPSAIMRRKNSKVVLLNFITGSTYHYFRSNIGKTNIVFELADKAKESEYIDKKIALLDNKARGYKPEHISIWLNHLLSNTDSKKVEWTRRKEELKKALN